MFIPSLDDGDNPSGYSHYISTTRQRSALTGYPTHMIPDDIVRVTLDERALHSRYKIVPIDFCRAKWYAVKDKWQDKDDFNKYHDDIMLQSNVEMEDRVLLNDDEIKSFHKYVVRIDLNNEAIDPSDADTIIRYCDKYDIPLNIYTNPKDFVTGR